MTSTLQQLIRRQDLNNNFCADCGNPNPQWASVSFAVFLCLQCAGVHRGFGVHISFVRSVSMDTWQSDQVKRMQLGGNAPFKHFVQSYSPAAQGGYTDGMDPHPLYHSWAATQYREKLDYALAGKPWAASSPPAAQLASTTLPTRPSSAQGLRKSRASARSPATTTTTSHASPQPSDTSHLDQKSANEVYFASLGHTNAARPTDLPPSQGGRYQGFGNTPSPPPPSQQPSFSLTSAAAPSLADFQDNPAAALSKGWSLFSAAVAGASRAVNDNVIQPGMERVMDPNMHANVRDYVSEAQRRAQVASQSVNEWSKVQLGVDVADHVNGIVGTVKDKIGAGPPASGYGSLAFHDDTETTALYDDTNDLFHEFSDAPPTLNASKPASGSLTTPSTSGGKANKDDDWDEWQDF
ncbi:ArfGap-domain-containing protein [Imleria badia]|nr:ArfGap-domain-containing protein [Imleria badia]